MNRAATINDVAREAGVSRSAVSKVIRDAYGVSDEMRARVNAAIGRLDYRPRVAARAMRGVTDTLGIELPDIGNPFFDKVVTGAMAALSGTGCQLIVAPASAGAEEGLQALRTLADREVDGIVAISPLVAPTWLEDLSGRMPVVMLGRHDRSIGYDTVTGDDAEGTRLVMDHLLSLGHERIAHLTRSEEVTAPGSGTPHAVRLAVYEEHMRRRGLTASVVRTGRSEAEAREAVARLLGGPRRPTAIFAGNDTLALGALGAVGDAGLSTREISVVGYDDVEIASHPAISLTSVDQAGVEMGRRAVELLLSRRAGRTDAVHLAVMPVLRRRRSSGRRIGGHGELVDRSTDG
ncbi:LacI family DNA-binding transcriptional regulator [Microbacterium sp. NPDC019599]|uniref:LacI family DNA-binding transcriptional regulator n=1 Tax=Microbacterium sp. NPDC019599 TaxID=3154690 RepID=UPI0033FF774B